MGSTSRRQSRRGLNAAQSRTLSEFIALRDKEIVRTTERGTYLWGFNLGLNAQRRLVNRKCTRMRPTLLSMSNASCLTWATALVKSKVEAVIHAHAPRAHDPFQSHLEIKVPAFLFCVQRGGSKFFEL